MSAAEIPSELIGQVVVLDTSAPFIYLGTLLAADHRYLILADADVHDLRESRTSRERYILESLEHGVRVNRAKVYVSRDEVVSFSALADVTLG
ncbi:MAG: hypothetical protein KF777_15875 [Planctomycetaceae bacterium]|nr:hypothetical protein [Planctomycetaceae bacterium]